MQNESHYLDVIPVDSIVLEIYLNPRYSTTVLRKSNEVASGFYIFTHILLDFHAYYN